MSRSEFLDESAAAGMVAKARNFISGDAQFFSSQPNTDQIRKQLDSDSLGQKKEGMKRIVAQIALGTNMSAMFPDVVKNIHAASIELRKLIYYFIIHYSEERPNEALLSISAFQQDLLDTSMHVRALALRTLSSIRIPAINPVVLVAIRKASTDISPLVRRTAALAILKANKIARGEDNAAQIIPVLQQLLGDRSMDVVGAAASTFLQLCPTRFDLIHRHYRRICRNLTECDEWGQIQLLHLLLRYARNQFLDPDRPSSPTARKPPTTAAAAGAAEGSDSEPSLDDERTGPASTFDLDPDHRLLVASVKPLFASLNRAVVIAAVSLFFHVAPQSELDACAKPLLRLLSAEEDGHYIALVTINALIPVRPKPFLAFIRDFYIAPCDSQSTRQLRLRILARLTSRDNLFQVVTEVKSYLRSYDTGKVADAIRCLGLITFTLPEATPTIIKLILPLLSHKSEVVVTEAVVVLRQLVVQSGDKTQTCHIVLKLAHRVLKGDVSAPTAKASILWLVGENIRTHANIANLAPDVFRIHVKSFTLESPSVKSQTMLLGAKIWVNMEGEGELAERFKSMFLHLLELVKYDKDYDVRDQGRLLQTVLDRSSGTFEAIKTTLLAPRPLPLQADGARAGLHLGSMSHVLGTVMDGYADIPSWPEEQPDPTTRDPPRASSSSSSSDDESEESSTNSSSSESAEETPLSKKSKSSSQSNDSESDDDTAAGAVASAAAKRAPAAAQPASNIIAAPVKVKIIAKSAVAKVPAKPRDRVAELFAPKPATRHEDPNVNNRAAPFTDAVALHGISVAYRITEGAAQGVIPVELRITNRRDEPLASVGLSDDHELGERLVEPLPKPVLHIDPSESATLRLLINIEGYPSIVVPLKLDADDEQIVPVTVPLPENR